MKTMQLESVDPHLHHAHHQPLSEMQSLPFVEPDLTPSEDDAAEEKDIDAEDVQSVIGVSIGHAQTHLASPTTPAAEKAAALDDIDGGNLFIGWHQSLDGTIEQSQQLHTSPDTAGRDQSDGPQSQPGLALIPRSPLTRNDSPPRLPSPWRAGPKKFQKLDDHRTSLRNTLAGHRRRALSGGSTSDFVKKYMSSFNLPSMPRTPTILNFSFPAFSVASSSDRLESRSRANGERGSQKPITNGYASDSQKHDRPLVNLGPILSDKAASREPLTPDVAEDMQSEFQKRHAATTVANMNKGKAPTIRRSASDNSLILYRSYSIASSLGDDTRFEHVQEQVNSRLKAIKDSWQDANFKLPALPNFSFNYKDDFFKSRSNVAYKSPPFGWESSHKTRSIGIPASSRAVHRKTLPSEPVPGASSSNGSSYPFFNQALEELTGDVVILGGYRGSVLRSAEPPHRQLWVPLKVGLNLRKVDLEVGLNPEDDYTMEERVIPAGMLTHIGPVDIAKRLFKRLRGSENAKNGLLRVHNYGYDWRLSPHLLSRNLIQFLENLPCNAPGTPAEKRGAIVIAHSLGGLITRHAINQRPELVAGVVYAGVPQTCVNILGPMRNGDDVLLSSRVLTAQVNFTIRTSYALLPLDGKCFFNKFTKEPYPIDFFDPIAWNEYRLSPCIAPPLLAPSVSSNSSMSGLLNAMSKSLPSLPMKGRKSSVIKENTYLHTSQPGATTEAVDQARDAVAESSAQTAGVAPQMQNKHPAELGQPPSPSTAVTISYDAAMTYLARTLAEVRCFKEALAFNPAHAESNAYPPIALIYGKSTPTVYGAKVESREAIKRADAYDELAFASGDGVVLARAAMVPEGYSVVRGGVVSSDRGHVTLLGDLEAVGRCLVAVVAARKAGVGFGGAEKDVREGEDR